MGIVKKPKKKVVKKDPDAAMDKKQMLKMMKTSKKGK